MARKTTHQHAFLMGLVLTDRGARLPLPRKSYYTEAYCRKHRRHFRTTIELAAAMIRELRVPDDVDVIVTFNSAFDAGAIHKACRKRHFHAVFPLDPNRVLARTLRQGHRQKTDRQVDVENPAPRIIVRNPSAQRGTDDGSHNHRQRKHRHRRAAFGRRKTFQQNRLGDRHHRPASRSLQNARQDKHRQAQRRPQDADASVNMPMQAMNTRFRPK